MTTRKLEAACKTCGEPFTKTRPHEIYCSVQCAIGPRIVRHGPDDCWPWAGARNDRGYGQVRINGRALYVHRLAYEIANGPISPDLAVCHRCDNPPCCNPAHHFLGTTRDNIVDMVRKGRQRNGVALGVSHPMAKLDEKRVREIRRLIGEGRGNREIATAVSCLPGTVWMIRSGKQWRSVV